MEREKMQEDSQAAARWRRDMKRSIRRIAVKLEKVGPNPKIFTIEEHPGIGPFLSEEEAQEWIDMNGCDPHGLLHIESKTADGSLSDVLRFVVAYANGALGDAPGRSEASQHAALERLWKAESALKEAEEALQGGAA